MLVEREKFFSSVAVRAGHHSLASLTGLCLSVVVVNDAIICISYISIRFAPK